MDIMGFPRRFPQIWKHFPVGCKGWRARIFAQNSRYSLEYSQTNTITALQSPDGPFDPQRIVSTSLTPPRTLTWCDAYWSRFPSTLTMKNQTWEVNTIYSFFQSLIILFWATHVSELQAYLQLHYHSYSKVRRWIRDPVSNKLKLQMLP